MKTIFAKYNNERLPKYQIVTKIVENSDGIKYAIKEATCDEAKEHIEKIYSNYELLKSYYDTNLVKPTKIENGLLFEMAEGKSLESILLNAFNNNDDDKFQKYINKFLDFVDNMVIKRNVIFEPSEEFENIFGKWEINEPQDIIKVANIDLIFGNIFLNEKDKFTLIDYEWIFDFEVPKSYIIWRTLATFLSFHSIELKGDLQNCLILNSSKFKKIEESFGCFVRGAEKKYFLKESIKKDIYTIEKKEQQLQEKEQQLQEKEQQLQEKEQQLQEKEQQIQEKEQQIQEKEQQIQEKEVHIQNLNSEIVHLYNVAQSMRIKNRIKNIVKLFIPQKIWKILKYIKNNPSSIKLGLYTLKTQGFKALINRISKVDNLSDDRILNSYTYNEPEYNDIILKQLKEFNKKPLISIIMPVYNVDPKWLDFAIKSIENQWYNNWELCIADDKSTNQETIKYLKSIKNSKIKIKYLEKNLNISGASNEALTLATGEYIALMDNDDEITPDALYEVVKAINETNAEFIYSDEDKIDTIGNCLNPYFKPDYSYDLLLSLNYICHFSVVKKSIIDEIEGFNSQYNGAQDYDLFLRVIEKTNKIYHISKVLYHWRMIETSTAMSSDAKPYAHDAGKNAVQSHFNRMGIKAKVIDSEYTFVLDLEYEMPNINPLVSIIIPTKDAVNYLEICISSIVNLSTYKNYEIFILNNNSEKEETFEWFKKVQQKYSFVKIIEANYEFNWSKLNNHGIKESKGEVYIFLNNDIKIITPNWIERLASKALQSNVGIVGALLLFEDDTIQHTGVVVGLNGWADHLYRTALPAHIHMNYTSPMVNRNVLAVTGACVAISKKTIEKIGNFSEDFLICGSDVEICLRAHENGYRNILDANTKLYHFESKTRSSYVPECDFEMSRKAYKYYWENGDPFYNKNLSLNGYLPNIRNLNEN